MAFVKQPLSEDEEIRRIQLPRGREIFGIVIEVLGSGKMRVECDDGLTRISRIRGKIRKRLWVREGDLVVVEPWVVQTHERADINWRYTRTQANWIARKGYLKKIKYS